MPHLHFIEEELRQTRDKGLYRSLRTITGGQFPWIDIAGASRLTLCSNDYLGLADHLRLKAAAAEAAYRFGAGAGASRLLSGTTELHDLLEKRLAAWSGEESALVFSSGYLANLAVIGALVGRGDVVLADRLAHASILDGIRQSGAKLVRYPHLDMRVLEQALAKSGSQGRRLVVTESIFSMDGDRAPLEEIYDLAERHQALLLVDEAHAVGLYGRSGSGLVEAGGLAGRGVLRVGTLGKSLGSMGGYFTGPALCREHLINRSRPFIFNTALAPPAVGAALAALDIVAQEPGLRQRLHAKASRFRSALSSLGLDIGNSSSQIVPAMIGAAETASAVSRSLWEEGVYAPAIRPPAVPAGACRLRLAISAAHTDSDIDFALEALAKVGRRHALI